MHIFIHENSWCRHKGIALQNVLWESLTLKSFHMIRVTSGLWIVPLLEIRRQKIICFPPALIPLLLVPSIARHLNHSKLGNHPVLMFMKTQVSKEPALNLYLVQAAQCVSLPGSVPLHKLSIEVCPPWFPQCRLIDFLFNDFLCWARSGAARADWARRACAFLLRSSAVL